MHDLFKHLVALVHITCCLMFRCSNMIVNLSLLSIQTIFKYIRQCLCYPLAVVICLNIAILRQMSQCRNRISALIEFCRLYVHCSKPHGPYAAAYANFRLRPVTLRWSGRGQTGGIHSGIYDVTLCVCVCLHVMIA